MDIESIQYQFVLAVQAVDSGYRFSLLTMLQSDPTTTLKTLSDRYLEYLASKQTLSRQNFSILGELTRDSDSSSNHTGEHNNKTSSQGQNNKGSNQSGSRNNKKKPYSDLTGKSKPCPS
jgi:hypothetical protein